MGAGPLQVARSHECDWPEGVLALPALTEAKFEVAGTSREIDERVKALASDGLSVYRVDADGLRTAAPDVILTQDQCEVCAVSLGDVERAVCDWTDRPAHIVSLRPHTMGDVYADILRIGTALGLTGDASALVNRMQERLAELTARVAGRPRTRIAFIEWIDPPMSGGHWMPELIAVAGGLDLLGKSGVNSPWIAWEDVAAADPDVIVVAPCGFDLLRTEAEMAMLAGNPIWRGLRAVRDGSVYAADGNAFFNRPGPRLVETAEIIAEILHGDVTDFGHRGHAYRAYGSV